MCVCVSSARLCDLSLSEQVTSQQLNAANATTYQKAPPKGEDTKSQERHDFDNWVYSLEAHSPRVQFFTDFAFTLLQKLQGNSTEI